MAEATPRVGLKVDGTPCLRCQKTQGGFCHQHLDQAPKHKQAAPPKEATVVASVTLADNRRPKAAAAAAAADELPIRHVGLKKDGTPCLNCVKSASGFCGQHQDQAEGMATANTHVQVKLAPTSGPPAPPAAKQSTSNTTSSSSMPVKVGLKKDGTPCSKCAATAGGFCHLHLDQADSAPRKPAVQEPAVVTATRAGVVAGGICLTAADRAPSQGPQQGGGRSGPEQGGRAAAATKQPEVEDSSEEVEDSGEEGGEEDLEDVEHATLVLGNKYPKFRRDIKSESLQAETWLPKRALNISNVVKSGKDKNNWLEFWADKTRRDRSLQKCAAARCTKCEAKGDEMVGGHVWVEGQLGVRHCYIVPICASHNKDHNAFDYPNWFPTKSDIALVRITTRRAFVSRIHRFEMRERA